MLRAPEYYTGQFEIASSDEEKRAMELIKNNSMPRAEAQQVMEACDDATPFTSRLEFMVHVASLTALFREECDKKPYQLQCSLKTMLFNLASPKKCEWLFNFSKYVTTITPLRYRELAVGTTGCSGEL